MLSRTDATQKECRHLLRLFKFTCILQASPADQIIPASRPGGQSKFKEVVRVRAAWRRGPHIACLPRMLRLLGCAVVHAGTSPLLLRSPTRPLQRLACRATL